MRKKQYVTFHQTNRLLRGWFLDAINNGTRCWDIVIVQAPPILFSLAVDTRSGDLTQKSLYEGLEYGHLRDIRLYLEENETSVEHVVMEVTIVFEKDHV